MKNKKLTIYGIVTLSLSVLANAAHLLWTVTVLSEYISNGSNKGIGMAFALVFTLITELASLPVLAAVIVYFVLHAKYRSHKAVLITNIALCALLILQAALTMFIITM